jgi:hypothetical protein
MAQIIERRTSQPYDVILAMLTRQSAALASPPNLEDSGRGRTDPPRVGLRIVRLGEGSPVELHDRLPA